MDLPPVILTQSYVPAILWNMEVKVVREWFLYVKAGLFVQSFIVEVEDSVLDVVGIADLHVE